MRRGNLDYKALKFNLDTQYHPLLFLKETRIDHQTNSKSCKIHGEQVLLLLESWNKDQTRGSPIKKKKNRIWIHTKDIYFFKNINYCEIEGEKGGKYKNFFFFCVLHVHWGKNKNKHKPIHIEQQQIVEHKRQEDISSQE